MNGNEAFAPWLDGVLARDIPAEVVAYCFTPRDSVLAIARADAGARWEDALQQVTNWVTQYLAAGSAGAATLKQAQAVAVGFVDGDLSIVWSAADEREDSRLMELIDQAAADLRNAKSPQHLRAALCRYLRQGAALRRSTGELVDYLGVSTPSIVDRAGYSDQQAEEVVRVLGTLTDEEISGGAI